MATKIEISHLLVSWYRPPTAIDWTPWLAFSFAAFDDMPDIWSWPNRTTLGN